MRSMLRRVKASLAARLFTKAPVDEKIEYLLNEVSELRQITRFLLVDSPRFHDWIEQTRASFDAQWDLLPEGTNLLTDKEFLSQAQRLIEAYTGLSATWFAGKTVLDAGCGNGRWAYVFSELGARVTAVDQSAHGIENVKRLCSRFDGFRAMPADLLKPLPLDETFDFVWSFGVLHHTGDTYLAFQNVQRMVKSDGMLFLMIYGEPLRPSEFTEVNTYVKHRRATATMNFEKKISYLSTIYPPELVHGYFDAISPTINDLYRFDELEVWLSKAGFDDIKRTFDSRNIFMTAHRKVG